MCIIVLIFARNDELRNNKLCLFSLSHIILSKLYIFLTTKQFANVNGFDIFHPHFKFKFLPKKKCAKIISAIQNCCKNSLCGILYYIFKVLSQPLRFYQHL